jgi:hypothetical protein
VCKVNVNDLHLDGSITVADLTPPEGVEFLSEPETVVVACVAPREEEDVAAAGGAEPEVIGRKADDGAGEGDD